MRPIAVPFGSRPDQGRAARGDETMTANSGTKLLVAAAGLAVSEEAYERISLDNPKARWELVHGRLREKPGMAWDHRDIISQLAFLLQSQLSRAEFRVHVAESRVRRTTGTIFIPDLVVVPTEFGREFRGRPDRLAVHTPPLPLVVEVWSHSTGDYDVETKFPEYRARGDEEIWRIHPYDRTLTAWRRQADGTYTENVYTEGAVQPIPLPGVTIVLDELFDQ